MIHLRPLKSILTGTKINCRRMPTTNDLQLALFRKEYFQHQRLLYMSLPRTSRGCFRSGKNVF